MTALQLAGLFGAAGMGVSLGLLGAGGATLAIPILVFFFGVPPYHASIYSLLIVGVCAGLASLASIQGRLVSWRALGYYVAPLFFGMTLARRFVLPAIPGGRTRDSVIVIVLICLMVGAAISMIRGPSKEKRSEGKFGGKRKFRLALSGLGVGSIAGIAGAGGGFLIVPSLIILGELPVKLAVGTSLVLISLNSLYGFLLDLRTFHLLDAVLLGRFLSCGVAGMIVGVWLNRRIKAERLRAAFGILMLFVAASMAIDRARSYLAQKMPPSSESSANRSS